MEEQATKVEEELITTFKKASEFSHCPTQCITYVLKPFFGMEHTRKWAEMKRIPVKLTVPFRI